MVRGRCRRSSREVCWSRASADGRPVASIWYRASGRASHLAVRGDLCGVSGPVLGDAVRRFAAGHLGPVRLDLSSTRLVDGRGADALLALRRELAGIGRELVLEGPSVDLARWFDLLHVTPEVRCEPARPAASRPGPRP